MRHAFPAERPPGRQGQLQAAEVAVSGIDRPVSAALAHGEPVPLARRDGLRGAGERHWGAQGDGTADGDPEQGAAHGHGDGRFHRHSSSSRPETPHLGGQWP